MERVEKSLEEKGIELNLPWDINMARLDKSNFKSLLTAAWAIFGFFLAIDSDI
jgi:hypothetical protein